MQVEQVCSYSCSGAMSWRGGEVRQRKKLRTLALCMLRQSKKAEIYGYGSKYVEDQNGEEMK